MDIKLYTINKYVSANQQVVVETDNSAIFDSFYIDTGENVIGPLPGTQRTVEFTYQLLGPKAVSLIGLSGGNTWLRVFEDFFQVTTFDTYDPKITRIFESNGLKLPWDCPIISPNEWVEEDNINSVFKKFYDNLDYLNSSAKIYDNAPTEYIGWYGTYSYINTPKWHVYLKSADAYTEYLEVSASEYYADFSQANDIKFHDGFIWIASRADDMMVPYPTLYIIKDSTITDYLSEMVEVTQKSPRDFYGKIAAFDFDSKGNIFVLDSKYGEVVVYNDITATTRENKEIIYLFKWGGKESFLAKTQFVATNDLHVDNSNTVHKDTILIVDTGNSCVKRFSSTGTWISTITNPTSGTTVQDGGPISVTNDIHGNLHILTYDKTFVFDTEGIFLFDYDIQIGTTQQPKKIVSNYGPNGFIYIVFDHKVLKFTESGIFAGTLTSNLENLGIPELFSATQNENGSLYITAENAIIKYVDLVKIVSIKSDTSTLDWPLSSVLIDKEEFVQDWIYNRSFARLWDNIEIFRRSIFDKFESHEIQPGINSLFINTFNVSDELYFSNSKNDIIIGTNEFVIADVVNRVIKKLCDNIDILKIMLSDRRSVVEPPVLKLCWSWESTMSTGQNPLTWVDIGQESQSKRPTIWIDAHGPYPI